MVAVHRSPECGSILIAAVRSHLICHNLSRLTWAATDQVKIAAAEIRAFKRTVTCGATDQVKMRQVV